MSGSIAGFCLERPGLPFTQGKTAGNRHGESAGLVLVPQKPQGGCRPEDRAPWRTGPSYNDMAYGGDCYPSSVSPSVC